MSDQKTPPLSCIGIIPDGNRRWAKEHQLSPLEGHRVGLATLIQTVRLVQARGIPHLVVYLFSTENWNREEAEVSYLKDLFQKIAMRELRKLGSEGVRVRFVGERTRFSADMQRLMQHIEHDTVHQSAITLWCCISYGGRAEILAAAAATVAQGDALTEENLSRHMWTATLPDPDLIIRTSGVQRLSGFLTWQSTYSELFFISEHWPAFSGSQLDAVLEEYVSRERRFGK